MDTWGVMVIIFIKHTNVERLYFKNQILLLSESVVNEM